MTHIRRTAHVTQFGAVRRYKCVHEFCQDMRRTSAFKTNIQVYKSANTQRFAPALRANRATKLTVRISQKAFRTPHIRYMLAGHALGTRWMGAICALIAGIFECFSSHKAHSYIVDDDPRTENLLFFARASVVRRSCISTRYWFVERAANTLAKNTHKQIFFF